MIDLTKSEADIDWVANSEMPNGKTNNSQADQQLDDDTVTLRGLSDEALEYITSTYDVDVV